MKRCIIITLLILSQAFPTRAVQTAQPQPESAPPACRPDQAMFLLEAQVDKAVEINSVPSRIEVMVRAAGVLWGLQQDKARAIFAQAYDLAKQFFQEQNASPRKEGQPAPAREDQRFAVIQAISKLDSAWARQLARDAVKQTRMEADRAAEGAGRNAQTSQASPAASSEIAARLLSLASSMIEIDKQGSIDIARSSLRHPPSFALPQYLFKLAGADQAAADHLYAQAVKAYANSRARELLLLSAYPFRSNRVVIGAQSVQLRVPRDFTPNITLQQLFLDALLGRADSLLNPLSPPAADKDQATELSQILIALAVLEPLLTPQPPLLGKALAAKAAIRNNLDPALRLRADDTARSQLNSDDDSFAGYVDKAQREAGAERRDYFLTLAVLNAPDEERLDRLEGLAQKVNDSQVRAQLLDWLYFKRSQKAIKGGQLDGAKLLAEKVSQVELRAYLSYEIAAESLKRFEDRTLAREALDAVVKAALGAGDSNEKVRTLLGVSHLYSKFDPARAIEVLRHAVKVINVIAAPDLGSTAVVQRIEGPTFGHFARYELAAFSLENAFREIASLDFDGALLLAQYLESKHLRPLAIISVAGFCLEKARPKQSPPASHQ